MWIFHIHPAMNQVSPLALTLVAGIKSGTLDSIDTGLNLNSNILYGIANDNTGLNQERRVGERCYLLIS